MIPFHSYCSQEIKLRFEKVPIYCRGKADKFEEKDAFKSSSFMTVNVILYAGKYSGVKLLRFIFYSFNHSVTETYDKHTHLLLTLLQNILLYISFRVQLHSFA